MKKLSLVGEMGTGKTSIMTYILKNRTYPDQHYPTMGVEAGVRVFEYPNEEFGLIQVWDNAGKHDNHKQICERYYGDTDGFLIVIDKQNQNTLKSVNYWLDKIKSNMRGKDYIVGVLANKADVEKPEFTQAEYRKMYGSEKALQMYKEVSVKDNEEVEGKTKLEEAVREFIIKMYGGNLLKVLPDYDDGEQKDGSCNCAVM